MRERAVEADGRVHPTIDRRREKHLAVAEPRALALRPQLLVLVLLQVADLRADLAHGLEPLVLAPLPVGEAAGGDEARGAEADVEVAAVVRGAHGAAQARGDEHGRALQLAGGRRRR